MSHMRREQVREKNSAVRPGEDDLEQAMCHGMAELSTGNTKCPQDVLDP